MMLWALDLVHSMRCNDWSGYLRRYTGDEKIWEAHWAHFFAHGLIAQQAIFLADLHPWECDQAIVITSQWLGSKILQGLDKLPSFLWGIDEGRHLVLWCFLRLGMSMKKWDMGGVWLPESTPVQDHLESTNRTNTRTTTVTQMCGHPILQTLEQADASRHWLNFGDAIPFHQQAPEMPPLAPILQKEPGLAGD